MAGAVFRNQSYTADSSNPLVPVSLTAGMVTLVTVIARLVRSMVAG